MKAEQKGSTGDAIASLLGLLPKDPTELPLLLGYHPLRQFSRGGRLLSDPLSPGMFGIAIALSSGSVVTSLLLLQNRCVSVFLIWRFHDRVRTLVANAAITATFEFPLREDNKKEFVQQTHGVVRFRQA